MSESTGEPEVTMENLEQMTNQVEAPGQFQASQPQEPQVETLPPSASELATQKGQASVPEIPDFLKETPFKTPDELAKGYKNLQGEFTKTTQRIKPYEQFLERTEKDRNFANFVEQARLLYDNPNLAQAYMPAQAAGSDGRPNPNAYDLSTAEGFAKYNQDFENFVLRNADSRVNARLSQIEQQNRMEQLKWQFKQKFGDADPDAMFQWAQQNIPQLNPFEVAYKLHEYDNLKSQATAEARKEINKQVETAQTAKTPTAASSSQGMAQAEDVIDYIVKHGTEKAYKKFGKAEVIRVEKEFS
jgi:hypothetical protein